MTFYIEEKEFTLQITEIEPDGNCLFGALVHQIFRTKNEEKHQANKIKKLREDVVAYINQHRDDFEHDLKGCVFDYYEGKKIDDIELASTNFLNNILSKDGTWAGSESIKAVARMNDVNILIVNENGDCYFVCDFDVRKKRTVILAFGRVHFSNPDKVDNPNQNKLCDANAERISNINRNHYNSVTDIDENDIFIMSKFLATQTMTKRNTNDVIYINESLKAQV